MVAPKTWVEVGFGNGWGSTNPAFTDVTPWARVEPGINIEHWRDVEDTTAQESRCELVLINNDGRFTPGKTGSPYYPNIKRNRPLRVRGRTAADGNMLTANQASMETSVADWESNTLFGTYTAASSITQSNAHPQAGSQGLLATWPTTAIGSWVDTLVGGFVIGRTYTLSAYVYVPAGSPDPRMEVAFLAGGTRTSVKNALTRISVTFVAVTDTHFVGVQVASASSGQQCYVDAVQVDEGSTVRTFTTAAPVVYDRFNGYVDDWVVTWPAAVSGISDCKVTASSNMARLGRGTELKSVIFEEFTRDGTYAYYPLSNYDEVSGSALPALVQRVHRDFAPGADVTFDGTGPATDGAAAAMFHAGKYLGGTASMTVNTTTQDFWMEFTINTTVNTGPAQGVGGIRKVAADFNFVECSVDQPGIGFSMGNGANAGSIKVNDGRTHHVLVVGNDTDKVKLYVDGVFDIGTANAPGVNGTMTEVSIGDYVAGGGEPMLGTISNVHFGVAPIGTMTAARVAEHARAVLDGFEDELPGARLLRYAVYGGMDPTTIDADTGVAPMAHIDTTGTTVLELMRKVETTEGGVLFDALTGRLTFKDRMARYDLAPAFTISYSGGEVAGALQFVMDDQQQVNDMTNTNSAGAAGRVFNQTSIDTHGYYREGLELNTTSDTEPQARAGWVVAQYAEPVERVSDIEVLLNTASSSLVAGTLSAQVGTRFTLSGLPSANAPATSRDFFVEGRAERITADEDRVVLHTSPAEFYDTIWILGDGTQGQLGETTRLGY